jgi:acyl carrier protein
LSADGLAMTSIEKTIRQYIECSFLDDGQMAEIHNDDDLLMILDSLQVLRMLMDLETEYSIKVDHSELTPENLGSIEKLAKFIERKRFIDGKQREAVC